MAVALVVGSNGQDGTFLCRRLLQRGYAVIGVAKQGEPRFSHAGQQFTHVSLDLVRDMGSFARLLREHRPDRIFHVAAVHASSGLAHYETLFADMLAVNVTSVHALLEYLRVENANARLLYASSAKVFGTPLPDSIDESTPRVSQCLYAVTKNAAGDAIRFYRTTHACAASQLFLFNHESELRPASFFVPKLARVLAARLQGSPPRESFASLDFYCDWGAADEYMDIAIDCLERAPAQDFVVATGRCLYARDLVADLAAGYGLSAEDLVGTENPMPPGQRAYKVSTARLTRETGRIPSVAVETVVRGLVQRYLQDATVQARGAG